LHVNLMNRGILLVFGLLGLAAAIAGFSVWFNHAQMKRIIPVLSPHVAELILEAPKVELIALEPTADSKAPQAIQLQERWYVPDRQVEAETAPDFAKMRRWLVQDDHFDWNHGPNEESPTEDFGPWQYVLVAGEGDDKTQLAFDLVHQRILLIDGRTLAIGPMTEILRVFFTRAFPEQPDQ
jgi:hypothetical protein